MEDREAAKIARMFSNPRRIGILRALRERRRLSPREYAGESGESLADVSYHLVALKESGILEVTDTARRPGPLMLHYSLSGPRAALAKAMMDLLAGA